MSAPYSTMSSIKYKYKMSNSLRTYSLQFYISPGTAHVASFPINILEIYYPIN